MLGVKVSIEELEEASDIYADFESELEYTIKCLEEAIEYVEDELSGQYTEKLVEILEQQISEINAYKEVVVELSEFIINIIDDINDTVDIESEARYFKYDEEQFVELVNNVEELLKSNSYDYKRIVQMSYSFEDWYNSEKNKLDIRIDSNKTLVSQTTSSYFEGTKLPDDRKVLNHNYKVMKKLDNVLQDIKFENEIEELQSIHKKLNKLELLNEYIVLDEVPNFEPITVSIPSVESIVSQIAKIDSETSSLEALDKRRIYKINANTFSVFKGYLTDKQWEVFTQYFNYEIVDEFCEITVNYDAFEILLLTDPKALDEVWEYFDEVGIDGIHKLDDVQKLPQGWETASKYITIGSYVVDTYTLADGIKNNDWGQVCSVPAGWGGAYAFGEIAAVISPYKWFIAIVSILGGMSGSKAGSDICNQIQEETSDIELHLNEGDTLFEAKIKAYRDANEYSKELR